jgi:cephalosporin hydroxylase
MDPIAQFNQEKKERIANNKTDNIFQEVTRKWVDISFEKKYQYNFTWLGRPIIQYPQDIIAMQEVIWDVKPDLIIETGIAHGGSIIFSASMLEIIGKGEVLGIDIDIRAHNRKEIEKHPMFKRISMIEGSSTSDDVVAKVKNVVKGKKAVLVFLDSNHTHEHVLKELNIYSQFVNIGSYIIAFDTFVEDLPQRLHQDRPWGHGNNPKTAVKEFLSTNDHFVVDETFEGKLVITSAPRGFLKRIK